MESLASPIVVLAGLMVLALVPFLAIMVTSFIKLLVVFMLLRNALGLPQVPPNMTLSALALILTLYIMAPVGMDIYDHVANAPVDINRIDLPATRAAIAESLLYIKEFLRTHAEPDDLYAFIETARQLWPQRHQDAISEDNLLILIPAFTSSELSSAFQIGFLLYLPFIVVDIIVSNLLLAMGMMMVSPMTISLPFKLFLFVLADGWSRLFHGLSMSYQ